MRGRTRFGLRGAYRGEDGTGGETYYVSELKKLLDRYPVLLGDPVLDTLDVEVLEAVLRVVNITRHNGGGDVA